jgi:hypothetical protein
MPTKKSNSDDLALVAQLFAEMQKNTAPALTEKTSFTSDLKTLIGVISFCVVATVSGALMWNDSVNKDEELEKRLSKLESITPSNAELNSKIIQTNTEIATQKLEQQKFAEKISGEISEIKKTGETTRELAVSIKEDSSSKYQAILLQLQDINNRGNSTRKR